MELVAQKREKLGKASKALRGEDLIPAEIYGFGIQNEHILPKFHAYILILKNLQKYLKKPERTRL